MQYDLMSEMDFVKEFCSRIESARKELRIPNIQPLEHIRLFKDDDMESFLLSPYKSLIREAANIKRVDWDYVHVDDYTEYNIKFTSKLNYKEAGKIFGKDTQKIGKLIQESNFNSQTLEPLSDYFGFKVGDFEIPGYLIIHSWTVDNSKNSDKNFYVGMLNKGTFFVLDTLITPRNYFERLAQEIIKEVNKVRRENGNDIGETIEVTLVLSEKYSNAAEMFKDKIEKDAKCVFSVHETNALVAVVQ